MDTSSLRYARIVQADGLGPVRSQIITLIGREKEVLDVGCSAGYLDQVLKFESACVVDGIELDPEAAALAERYCRTVYVGSAEDPSLLEQLQTCYDVIIFADVLEHLSRPEQVLAACRRLLKPTGYVLISIPNVAFWSIRREFLRGEWRYTETGILDHTHLRFYTYFTVREMVERAGYRLVRQWPGIAIIPLEQRLKLSRPGFHLTQTRAFQSFKQLIVNRYPNLFAITSLLQIVPQDA